MKSANINPSYENNNIATIWALPLLVVLGILPLIMYVKVGPLEGTLSILLGAQKQYVDFFCYYKMLILLICVVIAWIGFIVQKGRLLDNWKAVYIALAVYALAAVISTLNSEYSQVAVWGFPDRWEGIFTVLAYLSLVVLAAKLLSEARLIRWAFIFLFIGGSIVFIIGTLQYFVVDPFALPAVQKLVIPSEFHAGVGHIKARFSDGICYGTLYNPNYVGVFSAMLFIVSLILLIFRADGKQSRVNVCLFLLTIILGALLFMSKSRTGLISISVTLALMLALFVPVWLHNWKKLSLLVLCICLTYVLVNLSVIGSMFNKASDMGTVSQKTVQANSEPQITKIYTFGKGVRFVTDKGIVQLEPKGDSIAITDGKEPIKLVNDNINKCLVLDDQRFKGFHIQGRDTYLRVMSGNYDLYFLVTPEQIFNINNKGETILLSGEIPHWGFTGNEKAFGGRAYVWSRTFPMLKDTFFVGYGPDTFELYYPYHDYVGKVQAGLNSTRRIEKPHNQYLQTAVNTGVISMLAFIAAVGIYLLSSLSLFRRQMEHAENPYFLYGMACIGAVISYSISALANDSIVAVAPIFWVIMGIGMACFNRIFGLASMTNAGTGKMAVKQKTGNLYSNKEKRVK